jgi:hypothetical protein
VELWIPSRGRLNKIGSLNHGPLAKDLYSGISEASMTVVSSVRIDKAAGGIESCLMGTNGPIVSKLLQAAGSLTGQYRLAASVARAMPR